MTATTRRRFAVARWGMVIGCALLALPDWAPAQIGGGGSTRRRGGGIGLGDDPTDEAKQREAAQRKADEYLQAGIKLLDKGRIQAAKTKFKAVIELVGTEGSGQAALDYLKNLHLEGMARLEKAAELFGQGQYVEALKLAKETKVLYADLFGGIPGAGSVPIVSQEAANLIKQIEADPKAREAIQESEAAKRFKRIEGLEDKAKKDRTKYYDLYRRLKNIATRFPDCATGRECAKRLRLLEDDKDVMRVVKQEEDRRFIAAALRRAEQYERDGHPDKAKAEYAKLLEKHKGKTIEQLKRMAGEAKP
jgi:tetratricopeptide (TPR) repeat protein